MIWSIRLKFLIVMCGLLGSCLCAYLFMAITVFKSDKTQLVYDLNRSQVSNLTSELETQFNGVSDKLKLFALLPTEQQSRMVEDLFSEGSDIVGVSIFNTEDQKTLREFTQAKFLATYGLEKDYFTKLLESQPIPFTKIMSQGQDVWNSSGPQGPPLIGYGRLVVLQDKAGRPVQQWAVVGFVKLDRFLKSVSIVSLSELYVANQRGEILVHPDAKYLMKHEKSDQDPIFQEAVKSGTKLSLVNRELANGRVLAAYSKGFNDQIFVVAKASEGPVFQVVKDFTIRTFLFGSLVLTLVVLAAFMLSRSLTENIGLLVSRMELVSQGDLSSPIKLRRRDETVVLARTFNQMIQDLRESREDLETMNRELDNKVKERTAQLEEQNKKVKEAQEALIHTTRLASVGEIAGRTAHEVLNPLTILLTRLGLMQKRVDSLQKDSVGLAEEIHLAWKKDFKDGGFDLLVKNWKKPSDLEPKINLFQEDVQNLEKVNEEVRGQGGNLSKDIHFVKNEGERIGKIINAMRRLGHLKSEADACSVHEILQDSCHIMNDLFSEKDLAIVQDLKAQNSTCLVDRDEMLQAVTNLMRNSLQALDDAKNDGKADSPLRMMVRTYNDSQNLIVEIEDNGIGIPANDQKKLFESNFTSKSREQGTGLGLGISRRFVRSHNGDIEFVRSSPFTQTVFRIRLPLASTNTRRGAAA